MDIRVAEIFRLIQTKDLIPAFEKIDGEYFIAKNPATTGISSFFAAELASDSRLASFVNEPFDNPDKFLCDLIIYNQQRIALGLGAESTWEEDNKKHKSVVAVSNTVESALRLTSPDLYGKSAEDGKTNVNIWAAELMKAEDLLAMADMAKKFELEVAGE